MAVLPTYTVTYDSNCDMVLTDATTYGGGFDERNDVSVAWIVTRVSADGSTVVSLPTYNPLTVTTLVIDTEDGYYTIQMIITLIVGGTETATGLRDIVKVCDLEACRTTLRAAWLCKTCNDRDDNGFKDMHTIIFALKSITALVTSKMYLKADCFIQNIESICSGKGVCIPCCG